MRWLIWNTEHQGWRLTPEHGYTVRFWEAYRFDLALARHVVREGNRNLASSEPPQEIMVPAASPEEIEEAVSGRK